MALAALMVASALAVATLSRLGTRLSRAVAAGTLTLLLAFLQVPILARPLHMEALHLDDWILAVAGGLIAVVLPLGLGMSSARAARTVPFIVGCPRQPRHARTGVESHSAGKEDR